VRGRVRICRWGWVHREGLKGVDNIECRFSGGRHDMTKERNEMTIDGWV
jgi:hypothetical protein